MKAIDEAEVRRRLERDGKIQTIRFVMQEAEVCLSEAKQYVDSLVDPSGPAALETPTQTSTRPEDGPVRDLLARGEKLQAIKLVREQTGMSLSEAKNYVEALAPKTEGKEQCTPVRERRGGKGLLIAAILIVVSLGILLLMNLDKLF